MISVRLEATLRQLNHELTCVEHGSAYTIFGSAAMAMRGILPRDPGDVDIMTNRVAWAGLMARGWEVETPSAGDPPFLTLRAPIYVHAFYDWNNEHVHMWPSEVLAEAEMVVVGDARWKVAPLTTILRHKEEAMAWEGSERAVSPGKFDRHRADIEILKEAIAREAGDT